jgi:hypothetical protein
MFSARYIASLFLSAAFVAPVVLLAPVNVIPVPIPQRANVQLLDQDHRDFYGDLRITRALYGAGKHMVDVTAQLNAQIREGRLRIPVNNDTMGGDPYRNRVKNLTVRYTVDGHPKQVTLNEGDFLQLPPGEPEHDRDEHDHRGDDDPR